MATESPVLWERTQERLGSAGTTGRLGTAGGPRGDAAHAAVADMRSTVEKLQKADQVAGLRASLRGAASQWTGLFVAAPSVDPSGQSTDAAEARLPPRTRAHARARARSRTRM